MVFLNKVTDGAEALVAAKLEIMEPCASVKDRRAQSCLLSVVRAAVRVPNAWQQGQVLADSYITPW